VFANCQQANVVVPGLGVCLSELATTENLPPLPSVTGLNDPTNIPTRRSLEWWQILLMALGCAFIFLVILWLFRRRSRKQRAQRTAMFASAKGIDDNKGYWRQKLIPLREKLDIFVHRFTNSRRADGSKGYWRHKLLPMGEKLKFFGHRDPTLVRPATNLKSQIVIIPTTFRKDEESESIMLANIRAAEEARHIRDSRTDFGEEEDMVKLIQTYAKPSTPKATRFHTRFHRIPPVVENRASGSSNSDMSSFSTPSLYSQITGVPRKTPEPRRPVRPEGEFVDLDLDEPSSRFSIGSGSDLGKSKAKDKGKQKEEQPKLISFWK